MSFVMLLLFTAVVLQSAEAQSAADRILQAQYCASVERRAQHREFETVPPPAARDARQDMQQDVQPSPGNLSGQERNQLQKALDRVTRCSSGKLVYDPSTGFYLQKAKKRCR